MVVAKGPVATVVRAVRRAALAVWLVLECRTRCTPRERYEDLQSGLAWQAEGGWRGPEFGGGSYHAAHLHQRQWSVRNRSLHQDWQCVSVMSPTREDVHGAARGDVATNISAIMPHELTTGPPGLGSFAHLITRTLKGEGISTPAPERAQRHERAAGTVSVWRTSPFLEFVLTKVRMRALTPMCSSSRVSHTRRTHRGRAD